MSKQNKIFTAITAVAFAFSLGSCKKETTPAKTPETFNQAEASKISKQLLSFAMSANGKSLTFKNGDFTCVSVKIDTVSMPHTATYDYGSGCTDENGIVRKGMMILSYNSSDIQAQGTRITYSFSNFFINNDKVTGNMALENTGVNGNGNKLVRFTADVQDMSLVNGQTQLDASEYLEWTAGSNTPSYTDDIFSITGYYQASTQNGFTSKDSITEALIMNSQPGCNLYFVSGVTLTRVSGEPDKYLNYGDGTCDNLAVETVNGRSRTIVLQ